MTWETWLARQTRPPRPKGPSRARRAAQEKSLAEYIPLVCGHLTTREEQEFHAPAPQRGVYYCDKCEEWLKRKPRERRPPLPDVPPF